MDGKALYSLSYGVYLVTTMDGARPTGCVANSVMQITSSPATIAVSLNHDNFTNPCAAKCGKLAVTVLGESSDPALIGRFGFQSGKTVNKFDGLDYTDHGGLPVPNTGVAWLTCEVLDTLETDTHTVFLARVTDAGSLGGTPMTYAYYHNVIKGKSPKNAPTYQPEPEAPPAKAARPVWKCSVCGYIYDGDTPFEELPDSYTCPICKQPKSAFVKQE